MQNSLLTFSIRKRTSVLPDVALYDLATLDNVNNVIQAVVRVAQPGLTMLAQRSFRGKEISFLVGVVVGMSCRISFHTTKLPQQFDRLCRTSFSIYLS